VVSELIGVDDLDDPVLAGLKSGARPRLGSWRA